MRERAVVISGTNKSARFVESLTSKEPIPIAVQIPTVRVRRTMTRLIHNNNISDLALLESDQDTSQRSERR